MLRKLFYVLRGNWLLVDLHNEENRDLYWSRNCIRLIKSRRMKSGGACGLYGGRGRQYRNWCGELR